MGNAAGVEKNIIKNLPLVLFVVNRDFKMEFVNPKFKDVFGCENMDSDQVGKMIGCATLENGGTCTKEEGCSLCMLRKALNDCISKGRDVFHKIIEKIIIVNGRKHNISLKLTMNAGDGGKYICVVDDVSEIIQLTAKEKRLNEHLLKELSKAKNIQIDLLPRQIDFDGVEFEYIYRQLNSIGGDFFDIYRIDETHIGMYVADVSGHGVSGGMLTVFLAENFDKTTLNPGHALEDIYVRFNKYRFAENAYITILVAIIDIENNIITYSNAGHSVPMLLSTRDNVFELSNKGAPISNWFKTGEYHNMTHKCNSGDRIMLFTDGVTDARNFSGDEFGLDRLKKILKRGNSVKDVVQSVDSEIGSFADGDNIDDITLFCVSFLGENE